MNGGLLRALMALVRTWTYVYTSGLPAQQAERRRMEIASDLWESVHDADAARGARLPLMVLARLLSGIGDDLAWRVEQGGHMTARFVRRLAITGALAGAGVLWLGLQFRTPQLPPVHAASQPVWRAAGLPLPPPPPPPPPPAGRSRTDPIEFLYGVATYGHANGGAAPERLTEVRPVYPPLAVQYGISGRVGIEASIDEDGRVAEARVITSAHWMLSQSALNAVRRWEFAAGDRVPAKIDVTVDFIAPR